MRDEPLTLSVAPGSDPSISILKVDGPLTMGGLFAFQDQIKQHKPALLIIDLSNTPYMDSAGLGALMNAYVAAEKNGRRAVLAGANDRSMTLLELTKVHLILKNYATVAEAEAALRH